MSFDSRPMAFGLWYLNSTPVDLHMHLHLHMTNFADLGRDSRVE